MATSLFAVPVYPPKYRAFDANGDPLASGKLYTYLAGTSTPSNTYPTQADALAGTNANANPVVLDANGEAAVFVPYAAYKFVLKDSTDATQWTVDNVYCGIAHPSSFLSEWIKETGTLVYSSATQFKVSGQDVTATYHAGRRIKTSNTGGTIYSTVVSSSFATDTTINVTNDSGTLDSGLSAAWYGLVSYANPSYLSPRSVVAVIKNGDMTGFGSATKITSWTEQADVLSEYTTPTFTAKYAGYYDVHLSLEFSDTGTDVAVTGAIYVNGAPVRQSVNRSDDTAGEIKSMHMHWTGLLSVDDTVEAYCTGSANTTVKGTSGSALEIVRIR